MKCGEIVIIFPQSPNSGRVEREHITNLRSTPPELGFGTYSQRPRISYGVNHVQSLRDSSLRFFICTRRNLSSIYRDEFASTLKI